MWLIRALRLVAAAIAVIVGVKFVAIAAEAGWLAVGVRALGSAARGGSQPRLVDLREVGCGEPRRSHRRGPARRTRGVRAALPGLTGHAAAIAAAWTADKLAAAFLSASRVGDVHGLLAVLAPGVIRWAEAATLPTGTPTEIRGADAVVAETVVIGRRAAAAELALIDGNVGIVVAPRGRLLLAHPHLHDDRISAYDVVANLARLDQLSITFLGYQPASPTTTGRDLLDLIANPW